MNPLSSKQANLTTYSYYGIRFNSLKTGSYWLGLDEYSILIKSRRNEDGFSLVNPVYSLSDKEISNLSFFQGKNDTRTFNLPTINKVLVKKGSY